MSARKRINLYVGPKETIAREALAKLEASGEWVFEEKHDGFWCLATVENGVVAQLASRVGLAFEGAEAAGLLGLSLQIGLRSTGRVVGELTADTTEKGERAGMRRLRLFDVLDWNGHDLRELPQTERREALEMIYAASFADADVVELVEQRGEGITAWFDEIIARGGEGIVAKRRTARYRARTGDGKIDEWCRCKKRRTVDYIVMAQGTADKGTPNLDLGLFKKGKLTKVLTCSLPPEWRRFRPEDLIGRVVEAAGWEIWPSGALRSAQLGHRPGPRTDKLPESCTLEDALRSGIFSEERLEARKTRVRG
jgi:hypothetical protein